MSTATLKWMPLDKATDGHIAFALGLPTDVNIKRGDRIEITRDGDIVAVVRQDTMPGGHLYLSCTRCTRQLPLAETTATAGVCRRCSNPDQKGWL